MPFPILTVPAFGRSFGNEYSKELDLNPRPPRVPTKLNPETPEHFNALDQAEERWAALDAYQQKRKGPLGIIYRTWDLLQRLRKY